MRMDTLGGVSTSTLVGVGILIVAGLAGIGWAFMEGPSNSTGDLEASGLSDTDAGPWEQYDTEGFEGQTLWANGSLNQVQAVTGQTTARDEDRIDLGDQIPAGVPVRIDADLSYSPSAAGSDDTPLDLSLDPGSIASTASATNVTETPGAASLEGYVVQFEGTPSLVVDVDLEPTSPRVDYTLEIHLQPASSAIPARAPVEIHVSEPATDMVLEPVSGSEPVRALVWGPNGTLTASLEGSTQETLHASLSTAGSYVVAANETVRLDLVAANDRNPPPTSSLSPLPRAIEEAQPHALPRIGGEETWNYEIDDGPLGYTFRFVPTGPEGIGVLSGDGMEVRIASEAGRVVTEPLGAPAYHFAYDAPPWGADLTFPNVWLPANATDGAHEVSVTYDAAQKVAMIPGWIGFER